jgi:hypothetical protein
MWVPSELTPRQKRDHFYVNREDRCYFGTEYFSRAPEGCNEDTDLLRGYKRTDAVGAEAEPRTRNFEQDALKGLHTIVGYFELWDCLFVPVPSSHETVLGSRSGRITRLLMETKLHFGICYARLIEQLYPTRASHLSKTRLRPAEICSGWRVSTRCLSQSGLRIAVVDDILVSGAHFTAAREMLRWTNPDAEIVGCFLARRRRSVGEE